MTKNAILTKFKAYGIETENEKTLYGETPVPPDYTGVVLYYGPGRLWAALGPKGGIVYDGEYPLFAAPLDGGGEA